MSFESNGRFLAMTALAALAFVGCKSGPACTEIACTSQARVAYPMPVAAPYGLAISVGGQSVVVECPAAGKAAGIGFVIDCDANGFLLQTSREFFGSAPVDTETLVIEFTITPTGASVIRGKAEAPRGEKSQPNGPECPPTCWSRTAQATFE